MAWRPTGELGYASLHSALAMSAGILGVLGAEAALGPGAGWARVRRALGPERRR